MLDADLLNNTSRKMIELARLQPNEGQLPGLPKNPREIDKEKFELLKQNLRKYPELLRYCTLLVYPLDDAGNYIIIDGNMRYHALAEFDEKLAPCDVIDQSTDVEKLKAYIPLRNSSFGRWDMNLLANEWDIDDLNSWGLDLNFDIDKEPTDDELDGEDKNKSFTAKLTFSSEMMLKKFIKEQEQMLADNYGCSVSYSGGEL